VLALAAVVAACAPPAGDARVARVAATARTDPAAADATAAPTAPPTAPPAAVATAVPTAVPTAPALPPGVHRPAWLGTRPLPLGPDGLPLPVDTPPDLVVRRVPTIDLLPPPAAGAPFAATVAPLSDEVVARSTWTPACPVAREDLRHVTLSFWGFDERPHTGELIVHAEWADEVVEVFRRLFDERYPVEEVRVVSAAELEGTPTGDGNVTSAFVCRPARGSTAWSQHAYGLAVDINPFQNPYRRGDRVLPELAAAYLDRAHDRPGMLHEGSAAVQAFDAIGWGWGGRWTSLEDHMHFSSTGR
jgi:hypothetical protein